MFEGFIVDHNHIGRRLARSALRQFRRVDMRALHTHRAAQIHLLAAAGELDVRRNRDTRRRYVRGQKVGAADLDPQDAIMARRPLKLDPPVS